MTRAIISIVAGTILLFAGLCSFALLCGASVTQAFRAAGWLLSVLTAVGVALAGGYLIIREFDR